MGSPPNLTVSPLQFGFSGPLNRNCVCKATSSTAPHGHSWGPCPAFLSGPTIIPVIWEAPPPGPHTASPPGSLFWAAPPGPRGSTPGPPPFIPLPCGLSFHRVQCAHLPQAAHTTQGDLRASGTCSALLSAQLPPPCPRSAHTVNPDPPQLPRAVLGD